MDKKTLLSFNIYYGVTQEHIDFVKNMVTTLNFKNHLKSNCLHDDTIYGVPYEIMVKKFYKAFGNDKMQIFNVALENVKYDLYLTNDPTMDMTHNRISRNLMSLIMTHKCQIRKVCRSQVIRYDGIGRRVKTHARDIEHLILIFYKPICTHQNNLLEACLILCYNIVEMITAL